MDAKIEIEQDTVRLRPEAQRGRPPLGQQRQGRQAAWLVRPGSAVSRDLRKGSFEQTIAWFAKNENLSRYRQNVYTL